MNGAVLCVDCTSILNSTDSGSGPDSEGLKKLYNEAVHDLKEAQTIGGRLGAALDSLTEVYSECGVENWDGYDALPVSEGAYLEARKLVNMIPLDVDFPIPEIAAEPDGDIVLEWSSGRRRSFIVSVRGLGEITYTGLFGSNKTYGTENLGDFLPGIIVSNLRRLYGR